MHPSDDIETAGGAPPAAGVQRHAAVVEYDGAGFAGWQRQRHAATVQQAVEEALARVAAHPVAVVCAGRTDAGVHATHQVVHFDAAVRRPARAWIRGSNSHLPASVRIVWAAEVPPHFHARFSAERRAYRYVIVSRDVRPALYRRHAAWTYKALDADRMHAAAQALLGAHDFSSFRAAECQAKHARRTVYRLTVMRQGEFLYLDIEANAFLHHMVRNIAGVLMTIGAGEQPVAWAGEVLRSRDRRQASVTAPPEGLYLVKAQYPGGYGILAAGALPTFA